MDSPSFKTSTIFVTVGRHTHIYRSPEDMPEQIREKVKRGTSGSNTYTILIADKGGREELVRSIRGDAASIPLRIATKARQLRERSASGNQVQRLQARRQWLELALIALLAVLLWIIAVWR